MKISELVFNNDTVDSYIRRCVFNGIEYDREYKNALYALIHKAQSVDEFIDDYLNNDKFKGRQAYAVLSERCRPANHWYRIRKALGDRCFKTGSDAGGVKVGNGGFSTIFSSGGGDGETRCAVFNTNEWNNSFLTFSGSFEGDDIAVYAYDCGDIVAVKLEPGRYGVYTGNGFVVFERWI